MRGVRLCQKSSKRQHVKEIKDCKVLPLEEVAAQHKLLVVDSIFNIRRKKETKTNIPKTKWWKLKDIFLKLEYLSFKHVFQKLSADSKQDLWKKSEKSLLKLARKFWEKHLVKEDRKTKKPGGMMK
ncbi:hypothetical protein M8J77_021143 [Diaphorina citri]|nr:hypothetical protein M8J77_021143 [Diaphorina citri]